MCCFVGWEIWLKIGFSTNSIEGVDAQNSAGVCDSVWRRHWMVYDMNDTTSKLQILWLVSGAMLQYSLKHMPV